MDKHIILGIHITDRLRKVEEVQRLFSQYGCNIKTRLGLHEVENVCSPNGLVLLEMYGDEAVCFELEEKLEAIEGIEVQKMIFTH
ncbi:MAG: hypothetical protein NTU83_10895 [Candidatus Hydrogenedentes bacterium]|nr:hypothetical protein [Candidatus Hydrogenedentota bacterium]